MEEHKQVPILIDGELCQIDIPCVEMVKFFNGIGMKTQFCCQGNELNRFHIIFDKSVSDKNMIYFISNYSSKYDHSPFLGIFSKWCRKMSGEMTSNWTYKVQSIEWAEHDLNTFREKPPMDVNITMSKVIQEFENSI